MAALKQAARLDDESAAMLADGVSRADVDAALARLAEAAYHALAEIAVASRRLPAQDPRLTGRNDQMVLNAAFLVPEERRHDFHIAVAGLDDGDGAVTTETNGPWPAYSFATLERR